MGKIKINGWKEIDGKLSVKQSIQRSAGSKILITEGLLQCEEYIPEITKILCRRFALSQVEVISESLGSEENDIVYEFTFKSMEIFDLKGSGKA